MGQPIDAYRAGYEQGQKDTAGGVLAELTMGMLREDPGGYFAAGYHDARSGKKFSPLYNEGRKEAAELNPFDGKVAIKTICPNCGALDWFEWKFLGKLKDPICGYSWYAGSGTYALMQVRAAFGAGSRFTKYLTSGISGEGAWIAKALGWFIGTLLGIAIRLEFGLLMIPIQAAGALFQSKQTTRERTGRIIVLGVTLLALGIGIYETGPAVDLADVSGILHFSNWNFFKIGQEDQLGLHSIMQAQKIGLIDKKGSIVVSPQFDEFAGFAEGLAAIRLGEKIGFINKTGQYAINPKYDWPVTVWLYRAFSGDQLGRSGLTVAQKFSEGLALVSELNHENVNKTKYGYIDKSGALVIPLQFDAAWSFSDGLAPAGPKDQNGLVSVGYIDHKGLFAIPPQFTCGGQPFSDELAAVCRNQIWGYIDPKGKLVIEPQFKDAGPFAEGLASVRVEDKFGFIDKRGRFVINPQFEDASQFSGGLARVKVATKTGMIDRTGRFIVPARFDAVDPYHEGFAAAWVGDKCGYLDKAANLILDLRLGWCGPFRDGIAAVRTQTGAVGRRAPWSYIDKAGQFVFRGGE
jgi:hypothetical protein